MAIEQKLHHLLGVSLVRVSATIRGMPSMLHRVLFAIPLQFLFDGYQLHRSNYRLQFRDRPKLQLMEQKNAIFVNLNQCDIAHIFGGSLQGSRFHGLVQTLLFSPTIQLSCNLLGRIHICSHRDAPEHHMDFCHAQPLRDHRQGIALLL